MITTCITIPDADDAQKIAALLNLTGFEGRFSVAVSGGRKRAPLTSPVRDAILAALPTGQWTPAALLYCALAARGFTKGTVAGALSRLEQYGEIERQGSNQERLIRTPPAKEA